MPNTTRSDPIVRGFTPDAFVDKRLTHKAIVHKFTPPTTDSDVTPDATDEVCTTRPKRPGTVVSRPLPPLRRARGMKPREGALSGLQTLLSGTVLGHGITIRDAIDPLS